MASGVPKTYNGNFASPVMMDGFWHDMPYGRGTREHDPDLLPSATGSRTMMPNDIIGNEIEDDVDLEGDEVSEEARVFAPPPSEFVGDLGGIFKRQSSGLETKLLTSEGIVDHHWLSDAVQDPHRLPDQQDMITQLQNLWGDRTDGLFRVPVREVVEDAVQAEDNAEDLLRKEETFRDLTKTAARLVASGKRLDETLRRDVGPLWDTLAPKVAHLESERGLLGPVYLYTSSYPRLHRGKWAKVFRSHLKTAKYLIDEGGEDQTLLDLRHHANVHVVASVDAIPWIKVCKEVTGKRVSSPKEARRLVQAYYQAGPLKVPTWYHDGTRTIPTIPMDLVTPLEADRKFAEYVPPPIERPSLEARAKVLAKKKAFRTLGNWVKAGLLSESRGKKFAAELVRSEPNKVLKKAAEDVRALQVGKYQGEGEGKIASSGVMSENEIMQALQEAQDVLHATWETAFAAKMAKEVAGEHKKRASVIERYVREGRLSAELGDKLMSSSDPNSKVLKKAAELVGRVSSKEYSGRYKVRPQEKVAEETISASLEESSRLAAETQAALNHRSAQSEIQQKILFLNRALQAGVVGDDFLGKVRETMTRKEASDAWVSLQPLVKKAFATQKPPSVKTFEGPRYTRHLPETTMAREVHASERRQVLRKVSAWMHEGLAGSSLDLQLQSKVASDVQKAMEKDLRSFRDTHEGLAGQLYVIASHYASPRGVTGCEEGAKRHRQDGTKYVLAMDRCGPCNLRNAANRCSKYNKDVLWEVPADAKNMVRKARSTKVASEDPVKVASEAPVFEVAEMEIQVDAPSSPKDPIEISFEGGWSWQ